MSDELQEMSGDGSGGPAADTDAAAEELRLLKEEVTGIRVSIADDVVARRSTARNTLLCEWSGQSDDGRKHKDDLGKDPLPFEGASDNRVRLCDRIVQEHKRQLVTAATRATPRAVGQESTDNAGAARIETLLRWLIRNQWGNEFRRQVTLLAHYQEADTPAGAVCMVDWQREYAIRLQTVTAEEVIALHLGMLDAQGIARTGTEEAEAAQMVFNPVLEDALAAALQGIYPDLKPARAKRAAREIQTAGVTSIPQRYARVNLPQICALRVMEDVFFHANVTDLQRAPIVILREWLRQVDVLERAGTYGWSDEFVKELVGDEDENKGGHEAESAFDTTTDDVRIIRDTGETDAHAGLFEVLTAYRRAANEDGAVGIYVTTFSAFVEVAAAPTQLFDRAHGKLPFVYFSRECLNSRLIDSRGVAEIYQTDQQSIKLLKDAFEDHCQTTVNPPVKVPPGKPRFNLIWAPFAKIEANARDDVQFMTRPPYPQHADRYWQEMRREVNEHDGRPGPDVDPQLVQLAVQDRVDAFLAALSDVMMMVVQLCQQYMTDEQVQRIVGGSGLPIARSVEEIQGKYDVRLTYDMRDLDMEYVLNKAKVILEQLKPLDVRAVLPYEQIVARLLEAIDPNLAELIVSVQRADEREVREERAAFVAMLNGVEPEMREGGMNAPLRLLTLQQLIAERMSNPAAYPPVSPISQAMVENRIKYLTFQAQQMENADIGRVGTQPVNPREVEPAMPAGAMA